MIIIYPLLVSRSVSRVPIPAIAKALENFIITYRLDAVVTNAHKTANVKSKIGGRYKIKGGKIVKKIKENVNLSEADPRDFPRTGKGKDDWEKEKREMERERMKLEREKAQAQRERERHEKELKDAQRRRAEAEIDRIEREKKSAAEKEMEAREKLYDLKQKIEKAQRERERHEAEMKEKAARAKSATVKIGPYDFKTMSLEPTYISVDVTIEGTTRTQIIGVKVVPALVESDEQLSHLLLYDKQSKKIHSSAIRIGRWVVLKLYKIWDKLWKFATLGFKEKGAKAGTTTGDPRRDILMNRTIFNATDLKDTGTKSKKANIFVCLSALDISDDFFNSAGGINKLFGMGWTSIIVADDVNKYVQFCMEEYKGHCAALPYAQLFNNFGSMKVYEDLEDAKKASSALFKTKIPIGKMTGKIMAQSKLAKYRGR